jgi:hypothetical protein
MKVRVLGMAGAVLLVVLAGWLIVRFTSADPAPLSAGKVEKEGGGKSKRSRNDARQSRKPVPETVRRSSWFAKAAKPPEISEAQINAYLENNRRSPSALLAASRVSNNIELLREAAKAAPGDRNVQLELAVRGVTVEEKREALDRYRKLDPNNSYADYLGALFDLQQGRNEDAIANLDAADKHADYRTPLAETRQTIEDLYLSAGLTPVEAKAAALFNQPTVFLAAMSQLANFLGNANPLGMQSRDEATSARLLQSSLGFCRKIRGDQSLLISEMMRISVETRVLRAFPADEPLPGDGKTSSQRLEELNAERVEIATLGKEAAAIQADMTESEFLKYLKSVEAEGEVSALRNLRDK